MKKGAILSHEPLRAETLKWVKVFEQKGIQTCVLSPFEENLEDTYDFIFTRCEINRLDNPLALSYFATLDKLSLMGCTIYNGSEAIRNVQDKLRSYGLLRAQHIPTPVTYPLISVPKDMAYPRVLKSITGGRGEGIYFADSARTYAKIFNFINPKDYLVQAFLELERNQHGQVQDYRYIVSNWQGQPQTIDYFGRSAPTGQLQTNLCRGGTRFPIANDPILEKLAHQTIIALGAHFLAVDIAKDVDGRAWVLEGNICMDMRESGEDIHLELYGTRTEMG